MHAGRLDATTLGKFNVWCENRRIIANWIQIFDNNQTLGQLAGASILGVRLEAWPDLEATVSTAGPEELHNVLRRTKVPSAEQEGVVAYAKKLPWRTLSQSGSVRMEGSDKGVGGVDTAQPK